MGRYCAAAPYRASEKIPVPSEVRRVRLPYYAAPSHVRRNYVLCKLSSSLFDFRGHLSPLLAHPDWEIHKVCPIRSSPRRVKTCTPKIKKGCRWGVFRPFSLIPNGKYIKYVPSGPRLVVSKPAPLKSKRVAGRASFAPSCSPRKGGSNMSCPSGVPGLFVAVVFLRFDQEENTSGGQPKKIHRQNPFFAAQISGQHTQCDPAYADRRQAQAHETR